MKIIPIVEDTSTWVTIKQASQMIVDFGKFTKTLIFEPMTIIQQAISGLQGIIFPTALIILAAIIILKMIGFKDIEKWGLLTLIIYVLIIAL